jgi:hypothetical protein
MRKTCAPRPRVPIFPGITNRCWSGHLPCFLIPTSGFGLNSDRPTHQSTTNPPPIHHQSTTNPTIQQSTNPSIHQSINPSIHQSINPPIHQSTNPSIH